MPKIIFEIWMFGGRQLMIIKLNLTGEKHELRSVKE